MVKPIKFDKNRTKITVRGYELDKDGAKGIQGFYV